MHVGHARVESLIQEVIELTRGVIATVKLKTLVHYAHTRATHFTEVRSSSVYVVYVVYLRIIFSKAVLHGTH